jgi:Holliday junction resolvase
MTEQQIQKKITDQLTNDGWFVVKLMKTSINGIPDLMALKNGTTKFIEVKKPRGVISEIQKYRIKQLRKQGFDAVVMDGINSIIY